MSRKSEDAAYQMEALIAMQRQQQPEKNDHRGALLNAGGRAVVGRQANDWWAKRLLLSLAYTRRHRSASVRRVLSRLLNVRERSRQTDDGVFILSCVKATTKWHEYNSLFLFPRLFLWWTKIVHIHYFVHEDGLTRQLSWMHCHLCPNTGRILHYI